MRVMMTLVDDPPRSWAEDTEKLNRAMGPGRLWWVYVMIGAGLIMTGAGAATAAFSSYGIADENAAQVCLVRNGTSLSSGSVDPRLFHACLSDYGHLNAIVVLLGAACLPVVAWLLMIAGGLVVRHRFRPSAIEGVDASAVRLLSSRFAQLCDQLDLTGSRRPILVVVPPETGIEQAFTTCVPGARPRVVVPVAYRYSPRDAFDAVVIHELAHVKAKDVLWASAVWWAGWLPVPALVAAILPLLSSWAVMWDLYGISLLFAVVAAVMTLALRAALLRRRELTADRYVIDASGGERALTAMLQPGGEVPAERAPSVAGRVRRIFATHPSAAARLRAGEKPIQEWDGGFVFSAAAGLVAMLTYHWAADLLDNLLGWTESYPRLSANVAIAVAALLWSTVVIPSWTRRASSGNRSWTGSWAGATAGLVAGYCLWAPGANPVVANYYGAHLLPLIACLAAVGLAVAVFTASVATCLAATPGDRRRGMAGAVVAVTVTLGTFWNHVVWLVGAHQTWGDGAAVRNYIGGMAEDKAWQHSPALVLAGLLLVVLRSGKPAIESKILVVVLATGAIGGGAAALSWLLRAQAGMSADMRYLLSYQRWWICAIVGLVATVIVLLASRRQAKSVLATVPLAILGGLVATAVSGVVQFLLVGAEGRGTESGLIEQTLQIPGSLLLLALIATVPVIAATVLVASSRETRRGTVFWALNAATASVLLVAALWSGALSAVTVAVADGDRALSRPDVVKADRSSILPAPGEHGRALGEAAATAALEGVPELLPAGAQIVVPESSGEAADEPPMTPSACYEAAKKLAATEESMGRSAQVDQAYQVKIPSPELVTAIVSVRLTSYLAPASDLSRYDEENRECARFSQTQPDGASTDAACDLDRTPVVAYESYRKNCSATTHREPVQNVINKTFYALAGHNLVEVSVIYGYTGDVPPQDFLSQVEKIQTDVMTGVLMAL
ncbi:M48 family metalloprotease [Lentzea sp. NPDC058436]|uniref:M48 family metalloprotease n=1 Tax=Lentzea sp. NPDC058436 TaxID=3346499 RepID=UPI00366963C2